MNGETHSTEAAAILQFYDDLGVDTAEAETPGGLWTLAERAPTTAAPRPAKTMGNQAAPPQKKSSGAASSQIVAAEELAAQAETLDALIEAIRGFDGCPLKESAQNVVTHDGVIGAPVLVMGEAPGRDEDRIGKPFVGRAGQLLDKMLAAIGVSRAPEGDETPALISNVIYWRPPSNRNPTPAELAVAMPFARRFVALARPKLVLTAGKIPTSAFFPALTAITRARGTWQELDTGHGVKVPALPIFHPAFLLRQPAQKRWAWKDLQAAQAKLNETLS